MKRPLTKHQLKQVADAKMVLVMYGLITTKQNELISENILKLLKS